MGRKKILEKRMARLQKKLTDLMNRSDASTDATEVRNINVQMMELREDIQDLQDELDCIGDEGNGQGDDPDDDPDGEGLDAGGVLRNSHTVPWSTGPHSRITYSGGHPSLMT